MVNKKVKNRKKDLPINDTIISLIIVSENDEDIIEERIKILNRTLLATKLNYEIIMVDNSSTDQTVAKTSSNQRLISHTRILILSKAYDREIALTAGLDNCVGDFAILFNIYTDPPEKILEVIEKLNEGYDIVITRFSKPITKLGLLTNFFISSIEKLSSQGYYYGQSFLMGLNRKAINSIMRTRRKNRNFSYINSLIGFKKTNLIYTPLKTFKHKINQARFHEILISVIDTVISNSFKPIRFLSIAGMFFSLLFLFYVLIIVVLVVFFNLKYLVPQGWISLSTVLGSMFFLLFTILTLISEYVIRILSESRNEPFYFVSEEINQSVILPKKTLNIT